MEGKRQYEFLKLYIIPENDKTDKERNHETLRLANAIKSQKIVELQNETFGFNHKQLSNVKLTEYMERIAELSADNKVRNDTIHAIIQHLGRYDPRGILLKKVDKNYILGFLEYLKTAKQKHCKNEKMLHVNTQLNYFKMLRYCLRYAIFEDYIRSNPMDKIKNEEKPKR